MLRRFSEALACMSSTWTLATFMTAGKWLTLVAAHGVLVYALVMAMRSRRSNRRVGSQ